MARKSAELVGDRKLKRKLKRQNQLTSKESKAAVRSGLLLIQNDAKIKAPVLTGNLVRSITNEVTEMQREIDGRVGTETVYAPDVEFGTYKQNAQPYLRPAFDQNKEKAVREIEETLAILARKWNR